MVAIEMLATKARRELRALFLIDFGGLESMKMSTKWSRTVEGESLIEGGRKSPNTPDDGYHPLQLVHLGFTLFEMTMNQNESPKVKHILVIVDHFMRYTRAYVTKGQKVLTATKTLYEGFISIFECPKEYSWIK